MRASFSILGKLRGKARIRTKRGQFFKDDKTRAAETDIGWAAKTAMAGRAPMEGPVGVEINIWQAIPASWSRKKKSEALYLTGKPDCDNSAKLVLDALHKICFGDDSQISDLIMRRRYTSGTSRVDIAVWDWADSEPPRKIVRPRNPVAEQAA